jgi:hypothetical protein
VLTRFLDSIHVMKEKRKRLMDVFVDAAPRSVAE